MNQLTQEQQNQRVEAKALLTLEITGEDVKTLVDALQLLTEADMVCHKYGRRAILGICYGLEEAMGDLDLADFHLNG